MFLGIVHPEVMTLSVGIRNAGTANLLNFFEQGTILQNSSPQLKPVIPTPTRDHVVNRGESEALMIQVSVEHGSI